MEKWLIFEKAIENLEKSWNYPETFEKAGNFFDHECALKL